MTVFEPFYYLGFFFIYIIVILYLGKEGINRSETVSDYYVANRSLGLFLSVCTFSATWFSAASMLGMPALIYENGYSIIFTTVVCWFLGSVFLILMAKRLRSYQILTIPEFFHKRYNSKGLQVMTSIILIISYMLYIGIQIRGFGIVVSYMLDIPYSVAVVFVFMFLLYTTYGGLISVARTDVFNFLIIISGITMAAYYVLEKTGGFISIHESIIATHSTEEVEQWFGLFPDGIGTIIIFISAFFSLGLGLAANPQYAVRILSASSTKVAIRMVGLSTLILGFAYVAIIIIGFGSIAIFEGRIFVDGDELLPYLIHEVFDSPLKGWILMSIVAACVSTANSQLLILCSSFVYDFYEQLIKKNLGEKKRLSINKWSVVIFAFGSLIISLQPLRDLVAFSGQIWGIIAVTFFFPLFGGLFFKNVTRNGAFYSIVIGIVCYTSWLVFIPVHWQYYIQPVVPAFVISGIVFLMFRQRGDLRREN